jgi:hypothetical protein
VDHLDVHTDRPLQTDADQALVRAVTEIEMRRVGMHEAGLPEVVGLNDEALG